MTYIKTAGDAIANLESNMGAEQRARATYEHLMDMTNDPDVLGPLSFYVKEKLYTMNVLKNYAIIT